MKNADRWLPGKYVYRNGRLRATHNPAYLGTGSRLVTDLIAAQYDVHLGEFARGRLLDLGCGRAPLFAAYRSHVDEICTLDWKGAGQLESHVDVYHDLNQPLPFADLAFDTVLLSDVLEHVREPQQLCKEIHRVLDVQGRLIGNTPFLYPVHEAPHDYFRYTEHGLRHLLGAAGLRVVALAPLGGSVELACDLFAKHFAQLGVPGRVCAGLLQSAVSWFGRTGLGGQVKQASTRHITLGHFFVAERE